MRKEIIERIEIPEGIEVEFGEGFIRLKKGNQEIERKYHGFGIKKDGNTLELKEKVATKKEKKLLKTTAAHIRNAVHGLGKKFVCKLQICNVHFPMTTSFDKTKSEFAIKNFLGEVKPRIAKIHKNAEINVDKDIITLESYDREAIGQSAANIERATRITKRDRRTFQDGIYLIERSG